MRILIAGPPKSGNARLRCLLAAAYGLRSGNAREAPNENNRDELLPWLAELPEQSVVAVAFRHSVELVNASAEREIRIVPIIRHPFDLFVSSIAVNRSRATRAQAKGMTPSRPVEDQALDDPAILAYAREGFAIEIASLVGWFESGLPVVRFEGLEAAPSGLMTSLSRSIGPLRDDEIARALSICPADGVILGSPERGKRMPSLPSGSWRDHLPDKTLHLLRDRYHDLVLQLGYEPA